ncbi:MAG: hypothetical protein K1X67_08930 [Fimbriimonadaceae bacterium]|nr:hypothetical protein [Fimbriimonadaceae bacterium]
MNSTRRIAITALAALAASITQASVTAVPVFMEAGSGDVGSGGLLEMINSDNHRLVMTPTSTGGIRQYDLIVTLSNPLLMVGTYRRMEVRIEGTTSNSTVLMRSLMQVSNGTYEYLGAQTLPTSEAVRTRTFTGNMNRFIRPGGFVRLQLNGFFQQSFSHRFDRVSVVFFPN